MGLVVSGTERQTISIAGTEFKNLGGGGKVALEPLFTGTMADGGNDRGPTPVVFPIPSLRSTDNIYFTWTAGSTTDGVAPGVVYVDYPAGIAPGRVVHLTSKPCIRTVQQLTTGVKFYATDMFRDVTNARYDDHDICINAKITGNSLTMSYANQGGDMYMSTLIDLSSLPADERYSVSIGIGPFYKMLYPDNSSPV